MVLVLLSVVLFILEQVSLRFHHGLKRAHLFIWCYINPYLQTGNSEKGTFWAGGSGPSGTPQVMFAIRAFRLVKLGRVASVCSVDQEFC